MPITTVLDKTVVIDGRGHLLGRLAATVAKQLLCGQNVIVVRCEEINIAGDFFKSKLKFHEYLRKRCRYNPLRGPFHFRAPSKILYKAIRGMVPRRTVRGANALKRLKVFEGVPKPYDRRKRMVVPRALTHIVLKPGSKYCTVGKLSHEVGWRYKYAVEKLEAARKVESAAYYAKKSDLEARKKHALETAVPQELKDELAKYGY